MSTAPATPRHQHTLSIMAGPTTTDEPSALVDSTPPVPPPSQAEPPSAEGKGDDDTGDKKRKDITPAVDVDPPADEALQCALDEEQSVRWEEAQPMQGRVHRFCFQNGDDRDLMLILLTRLCREAWQDVFEGDLLKPTPGEIYQYHIPVIKLNHTGGEDPRVLMVSTEHVWLLVLRGAEVKSTKACFPFSALEYMTLSKEHPAHFTLKFASGGKKGLKCLFNFVAPSAHLRENMVNEIYRLYYLRVRRFLYWTIQ
eukprot:GAFH01003213.1.p1 GENE.GAFH01003213.1~~GAFH01003213.1.p1  ORF type:complete len:255 (+),score=44.19 GAFH01003213.1:206-970(+)